jgi:hypothetical protein
MLSEFVETLSSPWIRSTVILDAVEALLTMSVSIYKQIHICKLTFRARLCMSRGW